MTHSKLLPGTSVKSFVFQGNSYDIMCVGSMSLCTLQYRLYCGGKCLAELFAITDHAYDQMCLEMTESAAKAWLEAKALETASGVIVGQHHPSAFKGQLHDVLYGNASAVKSLPKSILPGLKQVHFPKDVAHMGGIDFAEAEDKMMAAIVTNVKNFGIQQQAAGVVWDSCAGMEPPHGMGLVQSLPPSEYGESMVVKLMKEFKLTKQEKFAALYGGKPKLAISAEAMETLQRFGAVLAG
jgi:hypothetical protein